LFPQEENELAEGGEMQEKEDIVPKFTEPRIWGVFNVSSERGRKIFRLRRLKGGIRGGWGQGYIGVNKRMEGILESIFERPTCPREKSDLDSSWGGGGKVKTKPHQIDRPPGRKKGAVQSCFPLL